MFEYTIINDEDGNDSFTVEGESREDALAQALRQLGWWMTDGVSIDEDEE